MFKRRFNAVAVVLIWLTGFAASPTALAQDSAEQSAFLVELLIFRHLDQSKTTPEIRRPENEVLNDPSSAVVFASAPDGARQLNGTASSIRNLRAYEMLAHLAWEQTALPEADAPLIDLNGMGLSSSTAIGTARLAEKRYLHLEVEIILPATGAVINAGRRIRLNRYYYLDHPDFGVIAMVTRTGEE